MTPYGCQVDACECHDADIEDGEYYDSHEYP